MHYECYFLFFVFGFLYMIQELYGSLPGIVVPSVVESLTTRRILTMEWMDGTKLPWGDDAERLIGIGLECSVYQLLEEGFLHAGRGGRT